MNHDRLFRHFIYGIADRDGLFYVGCACDVLARWSVHRGGRALTPVGKRLRALRERGEPARFLVLEVIHCDVEGWGVGAEARWIEWARSQGRRLLNVVYPPVAA